ncbi:hypothetical protein PFICI_03698 [Pestalotiopsis fici W106-1]|uniref:Uncharacterized protein n=1 Tax=Pestalotiopsis fici (strain W106-1 / CGMCC3.15140) TaxID=1229662 RepID=W3XHX6_PESFW|nr:uncharacterized protein PFICI_03698 [Pestalotiopsis fici W106-1]ETS85673.1 hypothetical protein PFICI_03698 [Pestalotiopsis fici W106-1]
MVSRASLSNLRVSIKPEDPVIVKDASPLSPRPLSTTKASGGITRRRLRASLPPSPVGSRVPPPQVPSPWRWRCCSCRATYDLSVTQRCLLCSHTFCSVNSQAASFSARSSGGGSSSGGIGRKRTSNTRKRRVDRSGNPITCTTEFDYEGWSAYGAWRRRVTGTQITEDQRDRSFLLRAQDDWHHCDFPSQCAHRRRELHPVWQDILLSDTSSSDEDKASSRRKDGEKQKKSKKSRRPSTALSPDDDLVMNEAISLDGSGRPSKQANTTNVTTLSDQQVLALFDEDDDDSDDGSVKPLEHMSSHQGPKTQLRVRNHAEADWENFSSDSDSGDDDDDDDDDDDEDLVDTDGNPVKWRNSAKGADNGVYQSQVLLVKAANSFWGATDF